MPPRRNTKTKNSALGKNYAGEIEKVVSTMSSGSSSSGRSATFTDDFRDGGKNEEEDPEFDAKSEIDEDDDSIGRNYGDVATHGRRKDSSPVASTSQSSTAELSTAKWKEYILPDSTKHTAKMR